MWEVLAFAIIMPHYFNDHIYVYRYTNFSNSIHGSTGKTFIAVQVFCCQALINPVSILLEIKSSNISVYGKNLLKNHPIPETILIIRSILIKTSNPIPVGWVQKYTCL